MIIKTCNKIGGTNGNDKHHHPAPTIRPLVQTHNHLFNHYSKPTTTC